MNGVGCAVGTCGHQNVRPAPEDRRGRQRLYIEEVGAEMPFHALTKIARNVPGGSRLRGPR